MSLRKLEEFYSNLPTLVKMSNSYAFLHFTYVAGEVAEPRI